VIAIAKLCRLESDSLSCGNRFAYCGLANAQVQVSGWSLWELCGRKQLAKMRVLARKLVSIEEAAKAFLTF
jgi:hypothetical protein